jgi:phosphoribosylanthranilate isomerase
MAGVRVKICGITRTEDALAAVRLGADALGFNFWPRSKRYCRPEVAREIIAQLPPFVSAVGIFVNQPRSEVRKAARTAGLNVIQLSGHEPPRACGSLGLPVIKAIQVESEASLEALETYPAVAFLLDTPSAGFGGSGRTFDWRLVRSTGERWRIILAGGLDSRNVRRAIREVRPYGVDVASGVESSPGIKDVEKMKRFISAAKEA